ncbi:MAG: RNA polymerase II subunit A C-terminal domain phosphatase [Chrysothrix sp. TS-e1954]|nr:MAG: RNA polymerase II subunit A C-terminal domain phosphatase [Chrysothrix sp. TS-e1954]
MSTDPRRADPRLARARPTKTNTPPATAVANKPPPPPPPPPAAALRNATSTPVNGATTTTPNGTPQKPNLRSEDRQEGGFKLRFCTVCASNNNRSMEGHLRLASAHYPVISFGTGSLVRLPGPSISQPNIYQFNTSSYEQMHKELYDKDPRLYKANGILNMLERNRAVKWGPERWQDWAIGKSRTNHVADKGSSGAEGGVVDVVITCEERCWDAVVDDLLMRGSPLNRPIHVFNVDIKDSHEEALVGGNAILDLADSLNKAAEEERETSGTQGWNQGGGAARFGFDERVPDILAEWQERWTQFPALWTLAWF